MLERSVVTGVSSALALGDGRHPLRAAEPGPPPHPTAGPGWGVCGWWLSLATHTGPQAGEHLAEGQKQPVGHALRLKCTP